MKSILIFFKFIDEIKKLKIFIVLNYSIYPIILFLNEIHFNIF